ncbi:PAS domain-containing protein [Salegentibacter sp. 24]|uniref:PAS domain-containing protein n=1 Tax=Salegentibacter sp. 24 TaxID=2183986 RepID=UPI001414EBF8|nr:PAS domain-containing protein [Salegentibacter sp. 24]
MRKNLEGALLIYSDKTPAKLQEEERVIFNFILSRLKDYFHSNNYKKLLQKRSECLSTIATDIQKRFELAAIASEILIYDWDLIEKKVIRFKRGNNKIWGYSSSKFNKGLFWNKLIHPEDFTKATTTLKLQLDNKTANAVTCRYRFKKLNGEYAFVQDKGYIIRDKEGIPIRIVGGVSDISDLVEKESELEVANERFSLAMKASNEMIYDWQVQKNEVTRSASFQKIYGKKNDQGSLDQWFCKIHENDRERIKTSFFEALENKKVQIWKQDYAFLINNEKIYVTDRCFILRFPSGKPKRIVGAVLDVTETKSMIEEIRTKNEILKDISWSQSHLVRAPIVRMQGILNSLDDPDLYFWKNDELFKIFKDSVMELDQEIRRMAQKMEDL